jgi:hypothetical protein
MLVRAAAPVRLDGQPMVKRGTARGKLWILRPYKLSLSLCSSSRLVASLEPGFCAFRPRAGNWVRREDGGPVLQTWP